MQQGRENGKQKYQVRPGRRTERHVQADRQAYGQAYNRAPWQEGRLDRTSR